jgi:superfamily II DNA or RNA helicase
VSAPEEFSPNELKVLELMAALSERLSRAALVDWLQRLDVRSTLTRAFHARELREILDRLVQSGWVQASADGREYVVADARRTQVLANAQRAQRLLPLTAAIRGLEPIRQPRAWAPVAKALVRELLWALELGLHEDARREYGGWSRSFPGGAREGLLFAALGSHPSLAGLERLPTELVEDYLRYALALAYEQLAPLGQDVVTWACSHTSRLDSSLANQLAVYLGLRGERASALQLLAAHEDASSCGTRAFLALTGAELNLARGLARQALERTRRKSSKRNQSAVRIAGLDGDSGVWLMLLLFTDPDAASHPYARAQLERSRQQSSSLLFGCLELLQALVSDAVDSLPDLSAVFMHSRPTWLETLFFSLLTRFRDKPLSEAMCARATSFAKHAQTGGFSWVAQALAAISEGSHAHGLLQLYAVEAPWQRTLRALEVALVSSSLTVESRAGEERLAWLFTLAADGGFQLTARLQTRTASGWSSGRQQSWKRLADAPPSAAFVSDRDRRVIQHLYADRESVRYGGSPTLVLAPRAALELIGHPHVFAESDCRAPLELVRGDARLEVQEQSGALSLTLAPQGLLRHPVVCERESSSRLVVYALDEAQLCVAQVFRGEAIRLPAEAQAATQQTLAKLASRFSLASDHVIAGAQIEELAADGRLRVRLRRLAAGVALRVCVVPLTAAPAFAPGSGSARLIVHVASEAGPKTVCAVRDIEAERTALQALYARCPTLRDAIGGGEHEAKIEELERCLELLCELRAASDVLVEWPDGEPLTLTPERDVRNVRLRLKTAADWLGAEGELEIDPGTRLALHELLARAAAVRGRFIALDDGRYLALTDKLKKTLDGMAALALVKNARVTLHPLWLGIAGVSEDYAELKCDAQAKRLLARVREASQLAPVLPHGFEAELRAYQREGFEWLSRLAHVRAGACLADDMGLGKTLQALALMLAEASHGPCLVVAPTSVCPNWFDEARRFAPALQLHDLALAERSAMIARMGAFDVLVCSYGLLQQELETLAAKHFRVLILDEAQAIKNAATQRARAAQQLVADIRIALTGTPVENQLGDLWSIMHFLNPGLLGSAKSFDERFAKPIVRESDARAARTLKRLIRPFILRRRKGEVLEDLPPKTVITLRVQPSEDERALLAALRERALSRLTAAGANAGGEARMQLLAELTRLRRAACHPKLVAPETEIASSKLEAFETLLSELREGGHRALVFSQFVDYLGLVRARLDVLGVSYQYLDGSCSMPARARAVSAFQSGEGDVFLISLKAGGFGLNLTAADYVVHLDPWWNPAVEEQASDRAHRIGQTRPVTIYRLVMQHSIEEKILALHADKRDLADRLLEGTGSASTLSLEELLALIRPDAGAQALDQSGTGPAIVDTRALD